ncbi:MAG: ABC transporter permease [Chitinophagaceae bacterium]
MKKLKKWFEILRNSLRQAVLELRTNKLRTTLSLLGVTFGIFCIIGVLTTLSSLEQNIQNDIKALGDNTIYIDKWDYSGGPDYPWWKYVNRPEPKFNEMLLLKKSSSILRNICFVLNTNVDLQHENSVLQNVNCYGPTNGFADIQPVELFKGRYFSTAELEGGSSSAVIGYVNAEKLFGKPENAMGKIISIKARKVQIVGVIKKQGKSFVGGWDFDQAVIIPYPNFKQIFREKNSNPLILVQAKQEVSLDAFKDELKGVMRTIRRLGPKEEDDFTLNAISDFSKVVSGFFASVSLGGWFIGLLSLIVGAFSIANIMFVTVKERTPIIGLKKAIGAKNGTILAEFLLESAFICLLGGLIGIILVLLLTFILTKALDFPIYISFKMIGLAISICIAIGVLAGIIPARMAAKLDPVVAIRS